MKTNAYLTAIGLVALVSTFGVSTTFSQVGFPSNPETIEQLKRHSSAPYDFSAAKDWKEKWQEREARKAYREQLNLRILKLKDTREFEERNLEERRSVIADIKKENTDFSKKLLYVGGFLESNVRLRMEMLDKHIAYYQKELQGACENHDYPEWYLQLLSEKGIGFFFMANELDALSVFTDPSNWDHKMPDNIPNILPNPRNLDEDLKNFLISLRSDDEFIEKLGSRYSSLMRKIEDAQVKLYEVKDNPEEKKILESKIDAYYQEEALIKDGVVQVLDFVGVYVDNLNEEEKDKYWGAKYAWDYVLEELNDIGKRFDARWKWIETKRENEHLRNPQGSSFFEQFSDNNMTSQHVKDPVGNHFQSAPQLIPSSATSSPVIEEEHPNGAVAPFTCESSQPTPELYDMGEHSEEALQEIINSLAESNNRLNTNYENAQKEGAVTAELSEHYDFVTELLGYFAGLYQGEQDRRIEIGERLEAVLAEITRLEAIMREVAEWAPAGSERLLQIAAQIEYWTAKSGQFSTRGSVGELGTRGVAGLRGGAEVSTGDYRASSLQQRAGTSLRSLATRGIGGRTQITSARNQRQVADATGSSNTRNSARTKSIAQNDVARGTAIKVAPNPAMAGQEVLIDQVSGSVAVYTLYGQLVWSAVVDEQAIIPAGVLGSGNTYFVRSEQGAQPFVVR